MEEIKTFINDANIVELLINGTINVVVALLIFVVGKWVANIAQNTLEKLLRKRSVDEVLVDFLGTVTFALVMVIAVVECRLKMWSSRKFTQGQLTCH